VALLTNALRCDLGVMISASHNPYQDNGIKLFNSQGYKLSDQVEYEIEKLLYKGPTLTHAKNLGRARRMEDAIGRYIELIKLTLKKDENLLGVKIVLDCANGAGYKVGTEASIIAKNKLIRNIVHKFQIKFAYNPPKRYKGFKNF